MSKINRKRIVILCVGLISLVVCIIFSGLIQQPGVDYTKEYQIYQDIGKMSQIDDVELYLDNMKIEYKIDEGKLTLPDYDSVEYVIQADNTSGYILHSSLLHKLSLLDERNLNSVTIINELNNDKLVEFIYIEDNGLIYSKIENRYYIEPTGLYALIIIVSFFASVVIIPYFFFEYLDIFFEWLKKKHNAKKKAAKVATDNSENETKES